MTRYYKTDENGKILFDLPTLEDAIAHDCAENAFEGELITGWDGKLYLSADDVPEKPDDVIWASVRSERDRLLSESDWTQMPDSPQYQNAEWLAYRQALRDLPETKTDPFNIVWPDKPDI